jgi:hypothetical protein
VLSAAPSPALLRDAGAPKTARAIEKALDLRKRCSEAKAALNEAQRAVQQAELRDRSEHAQAVAKSRTATLEPKHAEPARQALAGAERHYEALVEATETAALNWSRSAAPRRTRCSRRHGKSGSAQWSASNAPPRRSSGRWPSSRPRPASPSRRQTPARSAGRWRSGRGEVSRPSIRIDRLVAGNAALAPWLAQQPLPDEETERPRVYFGWHGGTQASG